MITPQAVPQAAPPRRRRRLSLRASRRLASPGGNSSVCRGRMQIGQAVCRNEQRRDAGPGAVTFHQATSRSVCLCSLGLPACHCCGGAVCCCGFGEGEFHCLGSAAREMRSCCCCVRAPFSGRRSKARGSRAQRNATATHRAQGGGVAIRRFGAKSSESGL